MEQLARLGAHVFEFLFCFGLLGSVGVVVVSVIEDVRDALRDEEHA